VNFAAKQSLKILITGIIIFTIIMVLTYKSTYKELLTLELKNTESIVDEISANFEYHLLEKVKMVKTLSVAPAIVSALEKSNALYGALPEKTRAAEIQSQDKKWRSIDDPADPFIQKYINNDVSRYLKNQQENLKGEYGEIFITNKYGAIIASTSKLTTLAHAHKYWWKGAYDNGAVFFDDRGYDDSVGGYVLGIVVPIKSGSEIIGILKANLNILGSIDGLLSEKEDPRTGNLQLIRSGGLIVYKKGTEPLSTRISPELLEKMQTAEKSFVLTEKDEKWLVGISEIGITSGLPGYAFGGSFESIDHKKGNTGESWYIVDYRSMSNITEPAEKTLSNLLYLGLILIIVLAFTSLLIGKQTAKPLKELIRQTAQIAQGNFDVRLKAERKDEIGRLGISVNQMAQTLKETTTSIDNLNEEIAKRKGAEEEIGKSRRRLKTLNKIIRHDLANDFLVINSAIKLFKNTPDIAYLEEIEKRVKRSLDAIKHYREYETFLDENTELVELDVSTILENLITEYPTIKFNVEGDCRVFADDSMYSIFKNLISNSIHHGEASQITIKASSEKDVCIITFSDNGKGIPDEIKEKIFDEGFSYGKSGKTGIGLHIVKQVVESYGGFIRVENNIPTGATFVITLRKVNFT